MYPIWPLSKVSFAKAAKTPLPACHALKRRFYAGIDSRTVFGFLGAGIWPQDVFVRPVLVTRLVLKLLKSLDNLPYLICCG